MFKVDFKHKVQDAEGNDYDVAPALALVLQHAREGDPVKFNEWAAHLLVKGELTLDKSDTDTLKDFIFRTPMLINLIKAKALECIGNKQDVEIMEVKK